MEAGQQEHAAVKENASLAMVTTSPAPSLHPSPNKELHSIYAAMETSDNYDAEDDETMLLSEREQQLQDWINMSGIAAGIISPEEVVPPDAEVECEAPEAILPAPVEVVSDLPEEAASAQEANLATLLAQAPRVPEAALLLPKEVAPSSAVTAPATLAALDAEAPNSSEGTQASPKQAPKPTPTEASSVPEASLPLPTEGSTAARPTRPEIPPEDTLPVDAGLPSKPPKVLTDAAVKNRLRRVMQPRKNGTYLVDKQFLEMYADLKGGGRDKVLALFEKSAYSPELWFCTSSMLSFYKISAQNPSKLLKPLYTIPSNLIAALQALQPKFLHE